MQHQLNQARILLIEDPAGENSGLEAALRAGGYTHIEKAQNASVIGLFTVPTPDLVILEAPESLELGFETLARVTSRFEDNHYVLTLVITPTEAPEFRPRSLELGAADVVSAQVQPEELLLRVRNLLRVHYALIDQEGIRQRQAKDREADVDALQWEAVERLRLMLVLSGRSGEAELDRVGELAEGMALALGASESVGKLYRAVAPLRDIGKIASIAPEESLRSHVEAGHRLLVGSVLPAVRLAGVIARTHHEHWDGSGCLGLKAKDIPLSGRIVAVAESFLARTGDPRANMPVDADVALGEVSRLSGTRFDPKVVWALGEVVREVIRPAENQRLRLVSSAA